MRKTTSLRSGVYLCVLITCLFAGYSDCIGQETELGDVVYLKNGSIIHGTIIEQIPGESLKIETRDGNIFVFTMDEIERVEKEPVRFLIPVPNADDLYQDDLYEEDPLDWTRVNSHNVRKKNPGTAFVLSLIFPGGGQFYNDESSKGLATITVAVLGYVLLFKGNDDSSNLYGVKSDNEEWDTSNKFGAALVLGTLIWSLVDALLSTSRINRENGFTSGYSVIDNVYVDLAMSDIANRKTPMLQAVYSF